MCDNEWVLKYARTKAENTQSLTNCNVVTSEQQILVKMKNGYHGEFPV